MLCRRLRRDHAQPGDRVRVVPDVVLPAGPAALDDGFPADAAIESGAVESCSFVAGDPAAAGALAGLGCVALAGDGPATVVVPRTRVVALSGEPAKWVAAFDLAVAVLDALAAAPSETGSSLETVHELRGPTVSALPVEERLALCGTLAAAGLRAVVPPDEKTLTWLRARRPAAESREGPPDDLARAEGGDDLLAVDAASARPIALDAPFDGARVDPDAEDGPPVAEVLVEGDLFALRVAVEALRDRSTRPGVLLAIVPATRRALLHAIEEGVAADLVRAGAILLPPGWTPPSAPGDARRVVTRPRPGPHLLASPAVAAASAVAGRLVHPERMRREHRRAGRRL